jgi:hypothetical protein
MPLPPCGGVDPFYYDIPCQSLDILAQMEDLILVVQKIHHF